MLRYKSDNAGTGSTPWTWTLDQGGGKQVVRSRFSEVRNGSGVIIGYRLLTLSNEVELYDLNGRLTSLESQGGHGLVFTYDAKNRLSRIDDDFGRYLDIAYNGGGIGLTQTTYSYPDPAGGGAPPISTVQGDYGSTGGNILDRQPTSITDGVDTITYTYEAFRSLTSEAWLPRLSSVRQRDNALVDYLYGETSPCVESASSGLLTGIIGADGQRFATYTYYNNDGEVTSSTHGAGLRQITYAYAKATDAYNNATNFNTSYINSIGKTAGSATPCPPEVCSGTRAKAITYDTYGSPLTLTDYNNRITTYTWDTTRALPLTIKSATGTALERTITYTWHADYRVPLTVVEPIVLAGVPGTRTTTYTYNAAGNPLTRTITNSLNAATRSASFTYNSAGLLETTTNARGKVSTLTYDGQGNLIEIENALGQSTFLSDYTARGLPGKVVDANGLETLITYDAMDRIVQVQRGSAATHWETTSTTYLAIGLVDTLTRPDGITLKFLYDSAHDLIEVRQLSASSALLGKQVFTLDLMGRLTKSEAFNAAGTKISTGGLTYSTLSRVSKQTGALSQDTLFTYDSEGNLTEVEDPLTHKRKSTLDALGRIATTTDALNKVSTLAYDPQDNLVSATDARGVATTYTYNAFNDMLEANSPDRGAWDYAYDAMGNTTGILDPRGVSATATFDDLDRPSTVVWDDSGVMGSPTGFVAGDRTATYTWDSCTHGIGRLCARSDDSGTTGYSYDLWGRLAGESFIPAGQTAPLSNGYGYDAAGRLDARVYPSGKALVFTYGSDGQVSDMSWAGTAMLEDLAWQPFDGPVLGWKWSSAGIPVTKSQVAFTYDLDGRLSHISDIDEIELVHDTADRLTAVSHQADPTLDQVHDYDANDRLVETDRSTWPAPWLYTWDDVGNRLTRLQTTNGWQNAYGLTHNRLSSVATVIGGVAGTPIARTYDAMGNTINDGSGKTYGFEVTGRLATFSNGAGTGATFVVGTDGLRSRKTVSGVGATDRLYAYDDNRRLIGVYIPDGSGGFTVSEELVYLPGGWRLVGTVRDQVVGGADGNFYPVLSDQLGAPRVVLDPANGDVRWAWAGKEAFGATAPDENPASAGVFRFDARFPGQWANPETGLFHNGFRDYDPGVGRYVQSDPIGLGGGWNTYSYAGGNAVGGSDPNGLYFSKGMWENPDFQEALRYLVRSPTAYKHLMKAAMAPFEIKLEVFNNADYLTMPPGPERDHAKAWHHRATHTIGWNTGLAQWCRTSGAILSPAMVLMHEIVHTTEPEWYSNKKEYDVSYFAPGNPGWPYFNMREAAAVAVENTIARELGGELVRDSHPADRSTAGREDIYVNWIVP